MSQNTAFERKHRKTILLVVPQNLPHLYDDIISELSPLCEIAAVPDIKEDIYSQIPSVDAMIGCPRSLFSPDLFHLAKPRLKWIHNPGAGVESFFTSEFVESDITFTNGKLIQGPECADHAVALLLSLTRNITRFARGEHKSSMPRPIELRNKTALVFGGGGIGLNVAQRLHAFGMVVSIVDNELLNMLAFIESQYFPEQLNEVVLDKDVIVCCAPLTLKTEKIFDKQLVSSLKSGSYFINVSRGGLVDLDAIIQGLSDGVFAGVGLDVTDPEPLPHDHELFRFANVIVTEHVAGLSDHNRSRSKCLIRENIIRFCRGDTLLNIVSKAAGY